MEQVIVENQNYHMKNGTACWPIDAIKVVLATYVLVCIPIIISTTYIYIQWDPSKWPPLGPVKVSLLEGWPHFRGEFVLKSMLWDFSKWPEYRGGHISGVLIRGVPLYICY